MKPTDEATLRRRLHEEIDLTEVGPAPVDAVFRHYRAVRARRLVAVASGVAVIAAAVSVLVARAPAGPAGTASGPAGQPGFGATPSGPAGGGVFASGTANGRRWRLAAVNLADPGYRCLPGVLVNGQNGDLLQPGFLPGQTVGDAAFWAVTPGRPGIGFAFLLLRPGVSGVTADIGDGTRRSLRPVTVTLCGQRFRLAGFEYPRQGVTRIVARSAQGRPVSYRPLAGYFDPASPFQAGTWIHDQGANGNVASGQIGSGTAGGSPWRVQVTLGPDGECYASAIGPAGPGFNQSFCVPVDPAPHGASLTPVPEGALILYTGTVSARTVYLRARLADGRTARLVPAVVAGRKYVVVGVPRRTRLTSLTLYDARGHVLTDLTSFPRALPG